MPTVVGLTFHDGGAIHFYTPGQTTLAPGDEVVAETAGGQDLARVVFGPKEMASGLVPVALRPVMRIATDHDRMQTDRNRCLVSHALAVVPGKISALRLPMKLIDVEAQFDGSRITVFFSAEGRVDFRELVRELVAALGVRVLMHQVGARDHAKMLGGIGSCGRELCCSTWMPSFEPISMRMAKEQSLFLNPSKFSGNCGKLKCCLRYEYDLYADNHDGLPEIGEEIETAEGFGRVVEVNIVKGFLIVDVPRFGRVEIRLKLNATPIGCDKADGAGGCSNCDSKDGNGSSVGDCSSCGLQR